MDTVNNVLRFWDQIKREAHANNLDPRLLAGLICQESAGNPLAERTEPDWPYHNLDLARPDGMSKWTEWWGQARSYGLCQVMGTVARENGFSGWWGQLFEVDTNLHLGAKLLASFIAWGGRKGKYKGETDPVRIGLLRYNGGGYKAYPGKVLEWAKAVKKELERQNDSVDHGP
jgi:soluble lytic murein transglycosylase-like protein